MARSNTFEAVAKELMDKFEAEGDAPATLKKKQWLLDFANKELGNPRGPERMLRIQRRSGGPAVLIPLAPLLQEASEALQ